MHNLGKRQVEQTAKLLLDMERQKTNQPDMKDQHGAKQNKI